MALLIALPLHRGALATDNPIPTIYYNDLSEELLDKTTYDFFDFQALRSFYVLTPDYNPAPETVIQQLNSLSAKFSATGNEQEQITLLVAYDQFIQRHIANLDVVRAAERLANQHSDFGDPLFFQWVADGLVTAAMARTQGGSLAQAFKLVTLAEEPAILERLGLVVAQRNNHSAGALHFIICTGVYTDTQEPDTIYFDATLPIRYLEQQEKQRPRLYLPR